MRRVYIRQYEYGLLFRDGDYRGLLEPGAYRVWRPRRTRIEVASRLDTRFAHPLLDVLLRDERLRSRLKIVDLNDAQRALIWKDDRLAYIVGPGRYAFWSEPYALTIEVYDANELRLRHPRLPAIIRHADATTLFSAVNVDSHEQLLLFRDGALIDTLGEGAYVFWQGAANLRWKIIDRREQTVDVAGQEIMTSDKVTLRVNLIVTYQVADAARAVSTVADYAQAVYREAQLALRAAVGTRTLDALLADKEATGGEVREALSRRAEQFGVAIRGVGLRDIMLPGEMKAIMNEVIAAEKQAQANLIKRREETAAARSQANTARLLVENPMLARLKELEVVQEILAGAKTTFVFGNTDVVEQVRRFTRPEVPDE